MGLVGRYRDAFPAGGWLAINHGTFDGAEDGYADTLRKTAAGTSVTMRERADIAALFAGYDLVEPGLVFTSRWRPDGDDVIVERPEGSAAYAGVGRRASDPPS